MALTRPAGMTYQAPRPSLRPASSPVVTPARPTDLSEGSIEERGAVFTRREIVDFILDLTGYVPNRPLHTMRLLEPSFGEGDFLLPAIDRLVAAWRASPSRTADPTTALSGCLRAVELHQATFARTRRAVIARLTGHGLASKAAASLADAWLIRGDFLLIDLPGAFDVVAGNPPYVRQELIPGHLLAEYRARYATLFDRADLYIPFIERSLRQLSRGGQLGFICADRWMKNRYGGPLRELVARSFHLKAYIDLFGTQPFRQAVIAYPAITVIAREKGRATRVTHRPDISADALTRLAATLAAPKLARDDATVREIESIAVGADPWILESTDQLTLVRRLEGAFPTLEAAGCKVGIGVATGADQAFIGPLAALDVEPDRKLPLVNTRDIRNGTIRWQGLGVVNPFAEGGGLVDLRAYPRLRAYLEQRRSVIEKRHVAKKMPANWYRTIDRIYPDLVSRAKLLIPDIKGEAHIVYDSGKFYPHHNLYFITSDTWDLKALQAVLMSGIARLFVAVYSTKMHGGYLRFQAQYLRRIRLPEWRHVPGPIKKALVAAAERGDRMACNEAVFALYGLDATERAALGGNGE